MAQSSAAKRQQTQYDALLAFCEGAHEVAFLRLVLKQRFGFQNFEEPFKHYPAPFNNLFVSNMQKRKFEDLKLSMAHKFFLPDRVMKRGDHLALLFNAGGKEQSATVCEFLSSYVPSAEEASTFPGEASATVRRSRYLHLYDADHEGIDATLKKTWSSFKTLDEEPWFSEPSRQEGALNAATDKQDPHKAAYIWSGSEQKGTLEDLLIPLFSRGNSRLLEEAQRHAETNHQWVLDAPQAKKAAAERAKLQKAIITTAGQRKKPGSSMSVILDQGKMISDETLRQDPNVQTFVSFLSTFLGLEPQP